MSYIHTIVTLTFFNLENYQHFKSINSGRGDMRLCMLYMNISVPLGKMMCGGGVPAIFKDVSTFSLEVRGGWK